MTAQIETKARAAAVALLTGYKESVDTRLQVYPGRPRSIHPPTGFVDRIAERIEYIGPQSRARIPVVSIVLIHATFDFADTVAQRDALVDGFLDWVNEHPHQMDANTLISTGAVEDDPNYIPDWIENAPPYFATLVTLEGEAYG